MVIGATIASRFPCCMLLVQLHICAILTVLPANFCNWFGLLFLWGTNPPDLLSNDWTFQSQSDVPAYHPQWVGVVFFVCFFPEMETPHNVLFLMLNCCECHFCFLEFCRRNNHSITDFYLINVMLCHNWSSSIVLIGGGVSEYFVDSFVWLPIAPVLLKLTKSSIHLITLRHFCNALCS